MRYIIINLVLASAICCVCLGEQPLTSSSRLETELLGKWIGQNMDSHAPSTYGLISIAFYKNRKVEWMMCVDGVTERRTGTYDIEVSENLFFPSTTSHLVRLRRDALPQNAPVFDVLKNKGAPVHLVNVKVQMDSRFPYGMKVLKFRDAFSTEFVCAKENGKRSDAHDKK